MTEKNPCEMKYPWKEVHFLHKVWNVVQEHSGRDPTKANSTVSVQRNCLQEQIISVIKNNASTMQMESLIS